MCCLSIATVVFSSQTAAAQIYTLSLHDALPISGVPRWGGREFPHTQEPADRIERSRHVHARSGRRAPGCAGIRSEEHTSELQSLRHLVCRLLLEKQKTQTCHTSSRLRLHDVRPS